MDHPVTEEEIIRVITGNCSLKERERVTKWMQENPDHKEIVKKLRETWNVSDELPLEQDEDKAWQQLAKRISRPSYLKIHRLDNTGELRKKQKSTSKNGHKGNRKNYQKWGYRAAAVCLLMIGVLYVTYNYSPETIDQKKPVVSAAMKKVKAERGQRLNLTLDDGTSVVLNSGSELRYPSQFSDSTREIELTGEAFFSVARNENKPFLVHTEEATVQVLGTKFNVDAYTGRDEVEVVVAEGKVAVKSAMNTNSKDSVTSPSSPNEVLLTKGEYTTIRQGRVPSTPVKVVSMDYHLGWVDGNLIFNATPLEEVIRRLELYYNRDFQVTNAMLLDRKLTATFKKESLSKVLDVLSIALDVKYEQVDSLIYLEPYSPSIQNDYSNK